MKKIKKNRKVSFFFQTSPLERLKLHRHRVSCIHHAISVNFDSIELVSHCMSHGEGFFSTLSSNFLKFLSLSLSCFFRLFSYSNSPMVRDMRNATFIFLDFDSCLRSQLKSICLEFRVIVRRASDNGDTIDFKLYFEASKVLCEKHKNEGREDNTLQIMQCECIVVGGDIWWISKRSFLLPLFCSVKMIRKVVPVPEMIQFHDYGIHPLFDWFVNAQFRDSEVDLSIKALHLTFFQCE